MKNKFRRMVYDRQEKHIALVLKEHLLSNEGKVIVSFSDGFNNVVTL